MPISYAHGAEPKPLPAMPEIPTDGSAYVIRLNRSLYTLIDIADVPLIEGWRFSAINSSGDYWYVRARRGSLSESTLEYSYLHTIITGHALTDHHNGCGFDNRRENLRQATYSQNNRNRKIQSDSSSNLKGVRWREDRRKWRAQIMIDGKRKQLGLFAPTGRTYNVRNSQFNYGDKITGEFDTGYVDAGLVYDMAAREYFKGFAALNYPIAGERSAITGVLRPMIEG